MSSATATTNRYFTFPEKIRHWVEACMPHTTVPTQPPWRLIPHMLLLAFILRAALALSGDFIIHADEIMQYLEPAHALVFGNGILHWEYYHGARSWLVPGSIAAILFLCKTLGLGEPAYYIPAVKLTLCAFSLLIPLCMYHLGRRLFGEATARTALLLGVFWYELVGYAHKPMTEFIATALFLALLTMVLRPRLTPAQAATASAFAVLVVAVRFQYAPLLALVWLIPFLRGCAHTRLLMLAAAAAAVCAVGLFDKLTWGEFLQSYRVNYHFNVALDAHRILYEDSGGYYLIWLTIASGGLAVLAIAAAALGGRARLFVLLLCGVVFLSHEVQTHREYRFLFVLIPLWLLLCADFVHTGWRSGRVSNSAGRWRWRQWCVWGWVGLVSAAGIANALPQERLLYEREEYKPEYRYFGQFLRNQDKVLALYRHLATDPSVRGVQDAERLYSDSGGYYTLHRKVPFYDARFPPSPAMYNYVSHIIAPPPATVQSVEPTTNGEWVLVTEGGQLIALPTYVSDVRLNQLVYWEGNGQAKVIEGFSIATANEQFTLWEATPQSPVHTWKAYRVYPHDDFEYALLEESLGDAVAPPPANYGIRFSENVAPQ